jgi:hypothetical protein
MKRPLTLLLLVALLLLLAPRPVPALPQANTYLVNVRDNADDHIPGDGVCRHDSWMGDYCSLQAAIQEAEADGVDSIIHFSKKFTGAEFILWCDIESLAFEDHTTIDASDRWDIPLNRPGVEIRCGAGDVLAIHSEGNTVRGIFFSGSDNTGIHIDGGNGNTIGGTDPHQRNVFTSGTGVLVEYSAANNTVIGNYFGTIDGEAPVPSVTGVRLQWGATGNTVAENVIGAHTDYGVLIYNADGNQVSDNIIGGTWNWAWPLPNAIGVRVEWADDNIIGPFNRVIGNTGTGVQVLHSVGTQMYNNTIGDCSYSSLGNGGSGVHITSGSHTRLTANGIGCNTDDGIYLASGPGTFIQGNGSGGNGGDGVHVQSTSEVLIGGDGAHDSNGFGGNEGNGVHLTGSGTSDVEVVGNEIGILGYFDVPNYGHGVLVDGGAHDNTIGGGGLRHGNWIAYNHMSGIWISGASTSYNTVAGNVLGVPPNWESGWVAGNGHHGIAVYDGAHHNNIGTVDVGNRVLDSGWSGIVIQNSSHNTVWYNTIGTDGAGLSLGNHYWGIHVNNGADNLITLNEVAYNGTHPADQTGVRVEGASALRNEITANSIHDNDGPGIELISGGNAGLPAPTVLGGNCRAPVVGEVSYACAGCFVDIYSDAGEEGRVWEGRIPVEGPAEFEWDGGATGPNVTATVTDAVGNTSPFSAPHALGATCNQAPTAAFTFSPPDPMGGDQCTLFTFNASASSDPEDDDSSLQVCWDWDNNGACETAWSTTKTAQYRLGLPTLQNVRLLVRDSWGAIDAARATIWLSGASCLQHFLPLVRR